MLRRAFGPLIWALLPADSRDTFPFYYLDNKREGWHARHLTKTEAAAEVPQLIDDLAATDPRVRSTAEFHLRRWTGVSIAHDWTGHLSDRPTLEEGREMRKQWLEWWKRNQENLTGRRSQFRR